MTRDNPATVPPRPPEGSLAELIVDRQEDRNEVLWGALMCCHECDHRLIEHDQVAFTCRVCSCDQSHRGLSAYADEYLTDLGKAMKEAGL